ncbi:hypothetical protein GCM10010400_60030 [Streptomyces aculeolatus]
MLTHEPGQVEADLDGDVGGARQMQGHIVRHPSPELAVEREIKRGYDTHTTLWLWSAQKRDVHEDAPFVRRAGGR